MAYHAALTSALNSTLYELRESLHYDPQLLVRGDGRLEAGFQRVEKQPKLQKTHTHSSVKVAQRFAATSLPALNCRIHWRDQLHLIARKRSTSLEHAMSVSGNFLEHLSLR